MSDWQLTATTIYCDAVDDDVTLLVDNNFDISCTGYTNYVTNLDKKTAVSLENRSRRLGKTLKCEGPQDFRVTRYRDKLAAESKTLNP